MKNLTFTFLLVLLNIALFAQKNFHKLSIGGGAGYTLPYADLEKVSLGFSKYGVIDYYLTPFITVGAEVQKGILQGGDVITDPNHQQFVNSYLSITVGGKVQLGEFLKESDLRSNFLYNIRGIYVGAGAGIIRNKVEAVRYYGFNFYDGAEASREIMFPLNYGINFYFSDKWDRTRFVINLNGQSNIILGEGLDGYQYDPGVVVNDIYSFYSVGIRYNFGMLGLDRRR